MRPCDLNNGLGQLTDAMSTLKERWVDTKVHWNDDKTRLFEQTYLVDIPKQLQFMLMAAQRLTEILEKAARECNDVSEAN